MSTSTPRTGRPAKVRCPRALLCIRGSMEHSHPVRDLINRAMNDVVDDEAFSTTVIQLVGDVVRVATVLVVHILMPGWVTVSAAGLILLNGRLDLVKNGDLRGQLRELRLGRDAGEAAAGIAPADRVDDLAELEASRDRAS